MQKYLIIIFLFISSAILAQDNTKSKPLDSLVAEAQNAYQSKEYEKAINAIYKIMAYPEAQSDMTNIFYFLADCYSLYGNGDSSLAYLGKSMGAGFADYRYIKNDVDLEFLRQNYSEKLDSMLSLVKEIENNNFLTESPIAIIEYENYTGPTDISKYKWPDYNQPMMDSLREKYQLTQIVKPGNSEFDKIVLLLDWVSNRWEHRGDTCANSNALAILAAAEKGARFCCGSYAYVLQSCLAATGYPSRFVGLMWQGGYKNGSGHGCVEVWSNQYQKWILLDAQNDAWWELDNIPLSAYECRRLFVDEKEGGMIFRGQRTEFDYGKMKSEWVGYFYHLFYYDNPQLNDNRANAGIELIDTGVVPEIYAEGFPNSRAIIDYYNEVYPRLNQTKISFRQINRNSPSDSLEISLSHTMPYFDKFLIRINGGDWRESKDTFIWALDDGENVIEAKAMNAAGIEGKISQIILRNNISLGR